MGIHSNHSPLKMNKLLLVFGTLFVLFVFLSEEAEGGKFLDNLCTKCQYCKDHPSCEGCINCSRCVDKKGDCRYCRKKEAWMSKARCKKGCKICGGEDGT